MRIPTIRGTIDRDMNSLDRSAHVLVDGQRRQNTADARAEDSRTNRDKRPYGCLPRITRYMARAIYYEDLIREGHLHDYGTGCVYVDSKRLTLESDLRTTE